MERVPFLVTGLASPATNRSWRRKHVLATGTWDGSDLQPQPLQFGEEETPSLVLIPRHWGSRASFCKINFSSLLGAMRHPLSMASRGPLACKATGSSWAGAGAPSSPEESWLVPGAQRAATGQGQAAHANGQVLGKQGPCPGGRQRRASLTEPALAGT